MVSMDCTEIPSAVRCATTSSTLVACEAARTETSPLPAFTVGFAGKVDACEIAAADSDNPAGPYRHIAVVLRGSGSGENVRSQRPQRLSGTSRPSRSSHPAGRPDSSARPSGGARK